MANVLSTLWFAAAGALGGYLFLPILVELGFLVLFALNKGSAGRDDYAWRNRVFLYYLGGIICFNSFFTLVTVYLAGEDTAACGNLLVPWCPALVRGWTTVHLAFTLVIQLYFAHCLKVWADNKKEDKQYTIL